MVRHQVVTVSATAQTLAVALGLTTGGSRNMGPDNSRCAFFSLQALGGNAGIIYLGGTDALAAATAYGVRLEIPISTVPSAPFFRENNAVGGCLDLADWQFLGTAGDKLSVTWEPYV